MPGEDRALSTKAGLLPGGTVLGLGILSSLPSSSLRKMLLPDCWNGLRGSVAGTCLAAISGDNSKLPPILLFCFSSLSALKNKSNGECTASRGTGATTSGSGEDSSCFASFFSASNRDCKDGLSATLGTDLEKNFGTGSDDGAGEA